LKENLQKKKKEDLGEGVIVGGNTSW